MRRILRSATAVALAFTLAGCYWTAPGGGPDRSGHNPFETTITPTTVGTLHPVWTGTGTVDGWTSAPVATEDGVFVTSGDHVYAFTTGGTPRWSATAGVAGMHPGTIVATGHRLAVTFTADGTDELYWHRLFDAPTGQALGAGLQPGAVDGIRDGNVAIGHQPRNDRARIEAGPLDDPAARWDGAFSVFNQLLIPMTIGARHVYQTGDEPGPAPAVRAYPVTGGESDCGGMTGVDVACFDWALPVSGGYLSSPVLSANEATVYVSTSDSLVYAVDTTTGAARWIGAAQYPIIYGPLAVTDDWVYAGTHSGGGLVAFPAAGCGHPGFCSPAWSYPTSTTISRQPAVAGGLVFAAVGNRLVALNAAGCGDVTCQPIWAYDTGSEITGAPAVSNGKVYVGTADGRLIAFGV